MDSYKCPDTGSDQAAQTSYGSCGLKKIGMKKDNRRNGEIVRSRISMKMVFLFLLDGCCCFLFGWFLYTMIGSGNEEKVDDNWCLDFFVPLLFMATVCLLCLITIFYIVVFFKYRVVINRSFRTMTGFSLWHVKGATLQLDDYAGYCVRTKTTRGLFNGHIIEARQEVCYLVDSRGRTYHIMSSISYRNYEQLKEALGLPEIVMGMEEDRIGLKRKKR